MKSVITHLLSRRWHNHSSKDYEERHNYTYHGVTHSLMTRVKEMMVRNMRLDHLTWNHSLAVKAMRRKHQYKKQQSWTGWHEITYSLSMQQAQKRRKSETGHNRTGIKLLTLY